MALSTNGQDVLSLFLLDASPEAMLIVDDLGCIRRVNSQLELLFGYRHDELIGQGVEMLIPEKFRENHRKCRSVYFEDAVARRIASNIELSCIRKNGEEFFSEIFLSPLITESQILVFCSIRDISRRVKTSATLDEKVSQLEALNKIGLAISSTKDTDRLLRLIVEQSVKHVRAESCALLLPDESTGGLVFRAAIDDVVGMRVPAGEGIVSRVLRSGKPEIINDVSTAPGHFPKIAIDSDLPTRSMLVVPLLVEGKSIGVLTAVNKIEGEFTEADSELLSTIACYAATSLRNAQLYDQVQQYAGELGEEVAKRTESLRKSQQALQQRNLELNRLYRASETLFFTSAPVLEDVTATIVKTVLAEFGKSNCSLFVVEPGKNEIIRVAVQGPYADEVSKGTLKLDGPGLVPRAFRSGEVVNIPDVRENPDYVPNWKAARSELAIPLKKGDQVIGVIDVQSKESNAFDQDDERLMGIFAERAALTLENVRLFESERRRRIEAETLRQASAVVAASLHQDEAIDKILEQLEHVVPFDSASVQLLVDGYLEIVGGRGWPEPDAILGFRFPVPGDNPNTEVIQGRKAIILGEASKHYSPFLREPHSHIRSWLGVPLVVREKVIGMLAVDHTQPFFYNSEHIRMASAFADHVAIAIENTRLFEEIQWLATTDELTGIHNRRRLFELGHLEIERARRYGNSVSAIMLDIDYFKKINDTYGHGVGDQVLRTLAQECSSSIREIDILGRYGGEEFAVVLPVTDLSDACIIAERLRRQIEGNPFETTQGKLSMTISLGVAEMAEDTPDLATLFDRADTALYAAKQAGRNCVRVSAIQ
ncbi:MAG: diguanylate cyclase [Chloroflexi bacterium]|nr:diguanylate cyclase [Chloroflexota bacterium]